MSDGKAKTSKGGEMRGVVRSAPAIDELPPPRPRRSRRGPLADEIALRVDVVTPILGGAARTRALDDIDVIRVPTVRGHLRFWWRALYVNRFADPRELHRKESELWGSAASGVGGGRSRVEVRIEVEHVSKIDPVKRNSPQASQGAYALGPAWGNQRRNTEPAPIRQRGTRFRLRLATPEDRTDEVRSAVRAWLLFGGYGSRTRRGLGSLTVVEDQKLWLPAEATRDALRRAFGSGVFASLGKKPTDTACLAGASLHVGSAVRDSEGAWTTALKWLREFRQGTDGDPGNRAREPGAGKPQPNRPSISNWPEADKVRHLLGKTQAHPPRHNGTPAWPRAGFGLPIIGRFQKEARDGSRLDEPDRFELCWRSEIDSRERDRLGSPLVVKALPLVGGSFVPCALWLHRAHPPGPVVLKGVRDCDAPFDRLVADGDTARFSALAAHETLRSAFGAWLVETKGVREVVG